MFADDGRSIFTPLFGNGRFLILFTGIVLIFSGLFVIVQSLTGYFLPHDSTYLGMDASVLAGFYSGRINKFMFHDRVAFGGSIIAVGAIYMWISEFPLKNKQSWSWWLLLFSGVIGFGSYLSYIGYGYLDEWHGIATLCLLPFFIAGLVQSKRVLIREGSYKDIFKVVNIGNFRSSHAIGVMILQFVAFGLFAGGITIMIVGMTTVFVPQDIDFMQVINCGNLETLNTRLVPLIAHDRACFGGGLATIGLMIFFIVRRTQESKSLWEILFVALNIGFLSAIGIHFYIGYTDLTHLTPAYFGYLLAITGLILTHKTFVKVQPDNYSLV